MICAFRKAQNTESGFVVPTCLTDQDCSAINDIAMDWLQLDRMQLPPKNTVYFLNENKIKPNRVDLEKLEAIEQFPPAIHEATLRAISNISIPHYTFDNRARVVAELADSGIASGGPWHLDKEQGPREGQQTWAVYLPFIGPGTQVISAPNLQKLTTHLRPSNETGLTNVLATQTNIFIGSLKDATVESSECGFATVWCRSHPDFSQRHFHRQPAHTLRFGLIVTFYEESQKTQEL